MVKMVNCMLCIFSKNKKIHKKFPNKTKNLWDQWRYAQVARETREWGVWMQHQDLTQWTSEHGVWMSWEVHSRQWKKKPGVLQPRQLCSSSPWLSEQRRLSPAERSQSAPSLQGLKSRNHPLHPTVSQMDTNSGQVNVSLLRTVSVARLWRGPGKNRYGKGRRSPAVKASLLIT